MAQLRREVSNFYELKVKEIMQKKGLPLIEKDAPVGRVLFLLTKKTHVWVTENKKSRKIVGVITEHDVLSILAPTKAPYVFGLPDLRCLDFRCLRENTAGDIMRRRTIKCTPGDTIRGVLDKMMKYGVRRLPVTERNNIIVGEIRLYHIIKKLSATAGKRIK
jgi:predicted transcriptional regulator